MIPGVGRDVRSWWNLPGPVSHEIRGLYSQKMCEHRINPHGWKPSCDHLGCDYQTGWWVLIQVYQPKKNNRARTKKLKVHLMEIEIPSLWNMLMGIEPSKHEANLGISNGADWDCRDMAAHPATVPFQLLIPSQMKRPKWLQVCVESCGIPTKHHKTVIS